VFLGYYVTKGKAHKLDIYNQILINEDTEQRVPVTNTRVFLYFFDEDPAFMFLLVLVTMMSFLLGLFLFYHLWSIQTGWTTNERAKKSQLIAFYEKKIPFFGRWYQRVKDNENKSKE